MNRHRLLRPLSLCRFFPFFFDFEMYYCCLRCHTLEIPETKSKSSSIAHKWQSESQRNHCFNYSSDFNCIFIISYIYCERAGPCVVRRRRPIEELLLLRWFCPVGKMRAQKAWTSKEKRELIMIWIKSKIDPLSIMIFNAFVMLRILMKTRQDCWIK